MIILCYSKFLNLSSFKSMIEALHSIKNYYNALVLKAYNDSNIELGVCSVKFSVKIKLPYVDSL